jgi:hypothetical protein
LCIEEFYIPPKTPKTKSECGVGTLDFGDVKVEHTKRVKAW